MDQKTVNTYNLLAQQYDDQTSDFWEKFPRTFVNKFTESVKGKVLDIGCGPGRDGALLKEAGIDIIGIDASETMVNMCKAKGIGAVVGDFLDLPFPENTFDGVWTYTSWLHVPKNEVSKAVAEAVRVLKPGGVLALGMIEGELDQYRETARVPLPRWFSFYTKPELEKLLTDHGLEVFYFEEFRPMSADYKNSKNYLNFICRSTKI